MNLLCYPLCLSGIETTWMKCLIAGSRSLFGITRGFIGSFKQPSKNQCSTAWLFFKKAFFFSRNKRVFLDLKEIKLNSNLIWMSGTMWFILYILIRAPLQPYRSSFVFIYSYLLSYLMHQKSSTYVRHNEIQIWTQQCKTAKKCRLIHTVPSFFLWGTSLSQYSFLFF